MARSGVARCLPCPHGRVSEDPVRSVGPHYVEQLRINRVRPIRLKQKLPVAEMYGRFFSGEESGSDPRAGSPEGKHRRKTASVGNSARSHDRNRRYSINHARDQAKGSHVSTHVSTRLPALRHNKRRQACLKLSGVLCSPKPYTSTPCSRMRAASRVKSLSDETRQNPGLLRMSRRNVQDENAAEALEEAARRLGVMAKVYDRLHLEGQGTVVDAKSFIEHLCTDLKTTIAEGRPIMFEVAAESTDLESSRAVTIGLIINKLLNNTTKYAFPDNMAGTAAIRFRHLAERVEFCLEVSDNGIGMSGDVKGSGIGTRLLEALTRQLGGVLERQGPPGTHVVVRFPVKEQATLIL
jgi:two-component sensor histidine kinase